ncbi:MAG: hypothetical protein Q9170_005220 [Blastenia crenularia]
MSAATPLAASELKPLKIGPQAANQALSPPSDDFSTNPPPQGFTVDVVSGTGGRPISNRIVFPLAINVLSSITALSRKNSPLRAAEWQGPPNSKILLAIGGPGARFFANYTVWGVSIAVRDMVRHNSFANYRFELHWQGAFVGQIWFVNGKSGIEASGTSELSQRTDISIANAETRDLSTIPDIKFKEVAGTIVEFNRAMMTVISGFMDIALHSKDAQLPSNRFVTQFPPHSGRLNLQLFAAPQAPLPAWFTYEFILVLLRKIVTLYIRPQATFLPVEILIKEPNGGPTVGGGHVTTN